MKRNTIATTLGVALISFGFGYSVCVAANARHTEPSWAKMLGGEVSMLVTAHARGNLQWKGEVHALQYGGATSTFGIPSGGERLLVTVGRVHVVAYGQTTVGGDR